MNKYPIILRVDHSGFGIPYWRPEDDDKSHSYIDLKKNPEQISLIPEVRDWPELKSIIEKINSPDGMYNTVGCAAWVYPTEQQDLIKSVTYIAFSFDQMDLNKNVYSYYGLFHHFTLFLARKTVPDDLFMFFEIRETGYDGGNVAIGWSGELGLQTFGSTVEDVRRLPNLAYSLFTEFLFSEVLKA